MLEGICRRIGCFLFFLIIYVEERCMILQDLSTDSLKSRSGQARMSVEINVTINRE